MSVLRTFQVLRGDDDREPGADPTLVGRTDAGMVRENNEDQFLIARLERSLYLESSGFEAEAGRRLTDLPAWLLLVADGMGGHDAGELASAVAVDTMAHYAYTMMPWFGAAESTDSQTLAEGLRGAVEAAQQRIRLVATKKGVSASLGTTLTMAYVRWPDCYVVHVGDSRAYLLRRGEFFRLTRDHNLAETMRERGILSEDQARTSRYASVLTNTLGGRSDDVHVELHRLTLEAGDRLLLCTDGLYGELGDAVIGEVLRLCARPTLAEICVDSLIDRAKKAGGRDNLTAILGAF